jgi:hypothetical protein
LKPQFSCNQRFFPGLAAYFIFGVLYMKFAKKASGKKLLPNAGFWSALPGNVKVIKYIQ